LYIYLLTFRSDDLFTVKKLATNINEWPNLCSSGQLTPMGNELMKLMMTITVICSFASIFNEMLTFSDERHGQHVY